VQNLLLWRNVVVLSEGALIARNAGSPLAMLTGRDWLERVGGFLVSGRQVGFYEGPPGFENRKRAPGSTYETLLAFQNPDDEFDFRQPCPESVALWASRRRDMRFIHVDHIYAWTTN
jgi:hypothetical protein